ncbi:MAG: hypothetical protein H3C27_04980 [Opitutaceae bacterium]|nr:hypothetical protein [Opitutaceae bacterium]
MSFAAPDLPDFLEAQRRDFGGKIEVAAGLWAVFAVPATEAAANRLVRDLLARADFPHAEGLTEDDQLNLYYVDDAHRPAAMHWLDDRLALARGEIRPVAPEHQRLIEEIRSSERPHRAARALAEAHEQGEVTAGTIRDAATVRALLDRLHAREPLLFAALQTLFEHHLIDLVVLLRQLINEDVALCNEIVKSGLSTNPFLQSRQDATAAIRNVLLRFHVINPLDQHKNISIKNPYAAFLGLALEGDQILLSVDAIKTAVPHDRFVATLQAVRRRLYAGEPFDSIDTQAPWMTETIAHPFRFIRQQVTSRSEFAALDTLYMLERATEG